jgi:nucleotide-binding universal stress UspA family protein
LYRKIISAVDGSFHSELAARHAVAIATSCNSELVALAVYTGEVEREELSFSVDRICEHAKKYGVQAKGVVREGELTKTILSTIYREPADLLVAATRQSDYRRFVRSIPQQLMLKAPCSMVAVKPAGIAVKRKKMLLPIEHREIAPEERITLASSLAKFYHHNQCRTRWHWGGSTAIGSMKTREKARLLHP